MPLKITTSDGGKHEVAEDVSVDDLLTGKTKLKGWVRVKPARGDVVLYVQLRQIVELRDEPDPDPERGVRVTVPKGQIPRPRRN